MAMVCGNGITLLLSITCECVKVCVRARLVCPCMHQHVRVCVCVCVCVYEEVSDPIITQWHLHPTLFLSSFLSLSPINSHRHGNHGIQLEPPHHKSSVFVCVCFYDDLENVSERKIWRSRIVAHRVTQKREEMWKDGEMNAKMRRWRETGPSRKAVNATGVHTHIWHVQCNQRYILLMKLQRFRSAHWLTKHTQDTRSNEEQQHIRTSSLMNQTHNYLWESESW